MTETVYSVLIGIFENAWHTSAALNRGLTVELMNLAGFIVYLQKGFSYSSDFSGQGYVRHTEEPLYRLVRFRRRNLALKKKKKKDQSHHNVNSITRGLEGLTLVQVTPGMVLCHRTVKSDHGAI